MWQWVECGTCFGSGTIWVYDDLGREKPESCPHCDGNGEIRVPVGFLRS